MTGAEQGDGAARGAHGLEQYADMAATALAERGTEREVAQQRTFGAIQHVARGIGADEFQVAAADSAEQSIARDQHLAAGLTRGGAAGRDDGDQHGVGARAVELVQGVEPEVSHAWQLEAGGGR